MQLMDLNTLSHPREWTLMMLSADCILYDRDLGSNEEGLEPVVSNRNVCFMENCW